YDEMKISQKNVAIKLNTYYSKINRILKTYKIPIRDCYDREYPKYRINYDGYKLIRMFKTDKFFKFANKNQNGYILEHRYVMMNFLDRPLFSYETVHHIDGNKLNNHLENLQLRSGQHGQGVIHQCLNCGSHNI